MVVTRESLRLNNGYNSALLSPHYLAGRLGSKGVFFPSSLAHAPFEIHQSRTIVIFVGEVFPCKTYILRMPESSRMPDTRGAKGCPGMSVLRGHWQALGCPCQPIVLLLAVKQIP
jgi:hypothetical protein